MDWGLALDCAGQQDQALARLREAAATEPTAHVYSQIAKVYGERQQWNEALQALARSQQIDPSFAATYAYRGIIYLNTNRPAEAIPEFEHSLALDPTLDPARQGLAQARRATGR